MRALSALMLVTLINVGCDSKALDLPDCDEGTLFKDGKCVSADEESDDGGAPSGDSDGSGSGTSGSGSDSGGSTGSSGGTTDGGSSTDGGGSGDEPEPEWDCTSCWRSIAGQMCIEPNEPDNEAWCFANGGLPSEKPCLIDGEGANGAGDPTGADPGMGCLQELKGAPESDTDVAAET